MKKEIAALAKALENLVHAVLVETQTKPLPEVVPVHDAPAPVAPVAPAPAPVAPVVSAPVAPAPVAPAPVAPAPVAPVVESPDLSVPVGQVATLSIPIGSGSHDEIRAHLLPVIQSNQNAMAAVHGVLTGQFQVNELTSLPVASIPAFETAVNAALAALPQA